MSEYQKFQEIKTKHEVRLAKIIKNALQEFQRETGAPVHFLTVDIMDTLTFGKSVGELVSVVVNIRTEG